MSQLIFLLLVLCCLLYCEAKVFNIFSTIQNEKTLHIRGGQQNNNNNNNNNNNDNSIKQITSNNELHVEPKVFLMIKLFKSFESNWIKFKSIN